MDELFCNACQIAISDAAERRSHYGCDWHRYNVKRRCAGLTFLSKAVFDMKKAQLQALKDAEQKEHGEHRCHVCSKTFSTGSAFQQHLNSKKHKKREASKQQHAARKKERRESEKKLDEQQQQQPMDEKIADEGVDDGSIRITGEGEVDSDEDDFIDPHGTAIPLNHCLFCPRKFKSDGEGDISDKYLDHMLKDHGFFIPFIEYLTDLRGLLEYLGAKIGLGHVCLYCNGRGRARYPTTHAVQQHMTAKSHCKLWMDEDDEDEDEFLEFYQFPGQPLRQQTSSQEAMQEGEDGEEGAEAAAPAPTTAQSTISGRHLVAMTHTGELELSDGSLIGHRQYNKAYRQNTVPSETRESVLIVQMMNKYKALALPGYVNKGKGTNEVSKTQQQVYAKKNLKVGVRGNKVNQHHFRDATAF